MAPPRIPLVERFWPKVDKAGPVPEHRPELGPCWLWTACSKRPFAYGKIRVGDRERPAHVVSFFLAHGRWPNPWGLHRCDNPRCVNPEHIFEGTPRDNMLDRSAKGRASNQNSVKTHCVNGHPLSGDNVYPNQRGRRCKTCRRARAQSQRRGEI